MTVADVRPLLRPDIGIFVGGMPSADPKVPEWKIQTMAEWAALAHEAGAHCHVGRINGARKLWRCSAAGVDSTDGTNATRFSVNTPMLTRGGAQRGLWERR